MKEICAGGYLPHRFSRARRFDNPSVYCDDLKALIGTIQRWTVGQLPPDIVAATRLSPVREEPLAVRGIGPRA